MAPLRSLLLLILAPLLPARPPPQQPLSNPPQITYKIPTIHESTILARRILKLSSIGTLSSVFQPSSSSSSSSSSSPSTDRHSSNEPSDLTGSPIGLMEYFAPCQPTPSNPTLLAITIAKTFVNADHGSNISLHLRWHVPSSAPPTDEPFLYSPANMPRFSLQGYFERMSDEEVEEFGVRECFLERHGEVIWTPGSGIHESHWGRLVVKGVYWFGGFGDRAWIGWLPLEEWEGITEEEIAKARLPGEEGYVPPVDDMSGEIGGGEL